MLPRTPLQDQKARLRAEIRARRQAMGADNPNAAKALADVFLASVQLEPGAVVSAYRAFRGEMDTWLLTEALRKRGHPIALPVILGKNQPLQFRLHGPQDVLTINAMGIEQPGPDAPVIEPDILLVPLLAFDRRRNRLGYGGGFYDRTLADLRTRKPIRAYGIAYSWQEIEAVPVGPNDVPLDKITTDVNFL